MTFSTGENRYSRQISLQEIGVAGQEKLQQAKVLIIGAGGLGSPVALYLAAAGVGTLGLVDDDRVDISNLQRQILYETADAGLEKTVVASQKLNRLNPQVIVEPHPFRLSVSNAMTLFARYDIIVDGTDNFPTRYLINDAAVLSGKPVVHGSVYRFDGQVTVFDSRRGACYRCLFEAPPPPGVAPSCVEGGVLGVLPGLVGTLQATEVIKLITGIGNTLVNRLLLINGLRMEFQEIRLKKNPACPVCGPSPVIYTLTDQPIYCHTGENMSANTPITQLTSQEYMEWKKSNPDHQFIDVREPYEYAEVHATGTTLIPLGSLVARKDELNPAIPAVIICRSGGRSANGIAALKAAGYKGELINLAGGTMGWVAAGFEVEAG